MDNKEPQYVNRPDAYLCPDCLERGVTTVLIKQGGCKLCPVCGYEACSL